MGGVAGGGVRVGHGHSLACGAYDRGMPYVLGAFAIIVPIVLVVQTLRGRARVRCCGIDPSRDLRLRDDLRSDVAAADRLAP